MPIEDDAIDPPLDAVTTAITEEIHRRASVGLRKYGVSLDRANLSEIELLQHAKEEALDLACYLQTLIMMKLDLIPPHDGTQPTTTAHGNLQNL